MARGMRRALNGRARRDQHAGPHTSSAAARQALCSPPAALPSILSKRRETIDGLGKIAVGKRIGGTAEHGRSKPANVTKPAVHGGSYFALDPPRSTSWMRGMLLET
eukprot:2468383-Prymnesium_polylepis.1